MSCLLIPRTRVCVLWDICQWQRTYALSKGIFFRNVHFYFNGLPQYFSLINTVYAHWWIIQSRTSNRCQRIQNAFPWIIYYFQKSSRFIEQVIGNTDVDQGLSAGNKVYYCFLFCACYKPGLHYKRDFSDAAVQGSFIHLGCWLGSWILVWFSGCLWMTTPEWECVQQYN